MKLYQILHINIELIPFELYKDKIVVTTLVSKSSEFAYFEFSYDYKNYTNPYNKDIYFYNLTDEDLTHLSLLGVYLFCSLPNREHPALIEAMIAGTTEYKLPWFSGSKAEEH